MYLHEDKTLFSELIQNVADKTKRSPAFVEKDYYTMLILRKLSEKLPSLLFKGGTSLSKCYRIINRFSEDLDITLAYEEMIGEARKKHVKAAIVSTCNELGLEVVNLSQTQSDRYYNCYGIDFSPLYRDDAVKEHILIETVFMVINYPWEEKETISMIGEYIKDIGNTEIYSHFGYLDSFLITVQSLNRTLVDKVFALCDYYLKGKDSRVSRHIYDIYKILDVVPLNQDLRNVFLKVREYRRTGKSDCPSAEPNVNIPSLLEEIVNSGYYKQDYKNNTSKLLYEDVSYEKATSAIKQIIDSNIFI